MLQIDVLASGSKGNAYFVSDGVSNILIEAGIPWKEIQRKSGFRKIDACFISHEHQDHAKALKDVLKLGISVYMPWEMAETENHHNAEGLYNNGHVISVNWSARAFSLVHDCPNLGYWGGCI
jgi:phosphoribosyl 1,2-cyclic phosphodiesterase